MNMGPDMGPVVGPVVSREHVPNHVEGATWVDLLVQDNWDHLRVELSFLTATKEPVKGSC